MIRIARYGVVMVGVVFVFTTCASTAPGGAPVEPQDGEEQEYVEALPPPQKPTITILPVQNETGITDRKSTRLNSSHYS